MNIESATKIIRQEVKTWAAAETPALTLGYDNLPFTRPEDGLYGMLSVLPGTATLVGIGEQKRWRTTGIAMLRLWIPMEQGEEEIHQTVDSFAIKFRSTTLQSVLVTRTPSSARVGRAGKWWQWNVTLPWYIDAVA